jgi:hypothetical protein
MSDTMTINNFTARASYSGTVSKTLDMDTNIGNPSASISLVQNTTFTNGDAANKANLLWYDAETIAASSNTDIDLVGSLTTAYGDTVSFDKIKGVLIRNTSTDSTCIIRVGGAGATAWYDWTEANDSYVSVKAGGSMMLLAPDANGYDIEAGSDTLRLANVSATAIASYEIAVIGCEVNESSSSESSSSDSSVSESSSSDSSASV